jgi:hypothetical protein
MTVLNEKGRTQINALEGQTILEIGFDISSSENISAALAKDQLRVVKWDGTKQTDLEYGIGKDYILSDNLEQVILNEAATAGHLFTILLNPPRTQGVTFPEGSFAPATQEAIADQFARMSIALDFRLQRVPSLIATYSGQLPFNPKGNARKVVGISEDEDSFTLFLATDIFPPFGGDAEAGRLLEVDANKTWLTAAPLIHKDGKMVCDTSLEVPTIKIGDTLFSANTNDDIKFSLDGEGNYVGIEREGNQLTLIPKEGGAGDADLIPGDGQVGYACYYLGEKSIGVMPTLGYVQNRTIVSDKINSSTLTLFNDQGKFPNLEYLTYQNLEYKSTFLSAETNYENHQIAFDFDPSNVVNGKFVQLYKEEITLNNRTYIRIAIRESDEDPRGNVSLSPSTPNPSKGQICVWEGHNDDDTQKFMYAGKLKFLDSAIDDHIIFEEGGLNDIFLKKVNFTFHHEGTAASVEIDWNNGLTHYLVLTDATTTITFKQTSIAPAAFQGTLIFIKGNSDLSIIAWPSGTLWPQGAKHTELSGVEDNVFEFYITALVTENEVKYFISPGILRTDLDTTTVESIASDAQPNQLVKYVGTTGKFIINDQETTIENETLKNWDFVKLHRTRHSRGTATIAIASGLLTIDLSKAKVFNVDLTGGINSWNFSNIQDGAFQIRFTNTTDETIVWPSYFLFENGEPPELEGSSNLQFFAVTRPSVKIFVTVDAINLEEL